MNILTLVSGWAMLLGGVLWALTSILHPNNYDAGATSSRFWRPASGGQAVAYLLLVLGVIGVYVAQASHSGATGLIGFVLALFGSAITFATNLNMTFLVPWLNAQEATPRPVMALVGPAGPFKWLSRLTALYLLTFVPGFLLLGVAVIRGGVFPAVAGWLIIVGMVVSNVAVLFRPIFVLRNVGGVVFGAGLAWLGFELLLGVA